MKKYILYLTACFSLASFLCINPLSSNTQHTKNAEKKPYYNPNYIREV